MTCGIYWFYQISQDRAVYIGSSVNIESRINKHKNEIRKGIHCNPHFQNTWNKYGKDDFLIGVLETSDRVLLAEREQFWMDLLSPCCNIAPVAYHPNKGRHLTDEHKQKLRNAHTGKKLSDEHKDKLRVSHLGKGHPMSQEAKDKIGKANRGRMPSQSCIDASRKLHKGIPLSDETKRKIGSAQLGKKKGSRKIKGQMELPLWIDNCPA